MKNTLSEKISSLVEHPIHYGCSCGIDTSQLAIQESAPSHDLKFIYGFLNRKLFALELPAKINLQWGNSSRAIGIFSTLYDFDNGVLINPTITITKKYQLAHEDVMNVMAHEMIHYKNSIEHATLRNPRLPKPQHGPEFIEEMKRVNATGLVTVTVKHEEPLSPQNANKAKGQLVVLVHSPGVRTAIVGYPSTGKEDLFWSDVPRWKKKVYGDTPMKLSLIYTNNDLVMWNASPSRKPSFYQISDPKLLSALTDNPESKPLKSITI